MQGLPQLAGVDPGPPPVEDVPGQGVELLDFEQAAPDPAAQFRLREVLRRMNSVLTIRRDPDWRGRNGLGKRLSHLSPLGSFFRIHFPTVGTCLTVNRLIVSLCRKKYSVKLKFTLQSQIFHLRTASGCFHFQAGVAINILFKLDLDRLDMPNFLSVFLNRTVRGKFTHACCIENGHPHPVFCVLISPVSGLGNLRKTGSLRIACTDRILAESLPVV